jgi:predicted amidohydrolase YtcJ
LPGSHHRVLLGHAKVMPDPADVAGSVADQVSRARRAGWPVAIHAVDIEQLDAALGALASVGRRAVAHVPTAHVPAASPGVRTSAPDRIEHVGLCLPEQVGALAAARVDVVTNPAFVVERARKYQAEISEVERAWLYRLSSLLGAGVRVAGASDAPTVAADPLRTFDAAVLREDGEAVDATAALALITRSAADISGWGGGVLRPGAAGDLVVLDADPWARTRDGRRARVVATLLDGDIVFGADELDSLVA